MKKIMTTLAVASLLLVTGCSSISSGTITNKDHQEGYYTTVYDCYSYDAKGMCSMRMPRQQWNNPNWRFDLKEGEETGWVYISEDTFNSYEVGDYYQGKDN